MVAGAYVVVHMSKSEVKLSCAVAHLYFAPDGAVKSVATLTPQWPHTAS
jgi:hypothetical protein